MTRHSEPGYYWILNASVADLCGSRAGDPSPVGKPNVFVIEVDVRAGGSLLADNRRVALCHGDHRLFPERVCMT
jgi:hypothetical protein